MDGGGADQVGAVAGVELVHVGDMLEVVGVQVAVLHRGVGLNVVVEDRDLQGDALLGQQLLDHLQDLGVGRGRGSYLKNGTFQAAGLGRAGLRRGRLRGGGSGGAAVAAAGQQAERQHAGEEQRDKFFHVAFSFFKKCYTTEAAGPSPAGDNLR